MSISLFKRTSFKLGCNAGNDKIEPELISDPHMYIFFKKGTRSENSYISNRYCKANTKFLKSYDPKQESKYIRDIDANNLYGYPMPKFLPVN